MYKSIVAAVVLTAGAASADGITGSPSSSAGSDVERVPTKEEIQPGVSQCDGGGGGGVWLQSHCLNNDDIVELAKFIRVFHDV